MHTSLFDVLGGCFADGRPLASVPAEQRRLHSVVSNLHRLFNTRRGTVRHLPGYGLPDISEIYRDIPESIPDLRRAIQEAVAQYEPRLRYARVEHQHTDAYTMQLVFLLSAQLVEGAPVRFRTTFTSNESARVSPFRR